MAIGDGSATRGQPDNVPGPGGRDGQGVPGLRRGWQVDRPTAQVLGAEQDETLVVEGSGRGVEVLREQPVPGCVPTGGRTPPAGRGWEGGPPAIDR